MDQRQEQKDTAADGTVVTAKVASERPKQALTVTWNHLPRWQQDNHYIHTGYRPASNSYSKSVASLSYVHNETINIYSHLIGAVLAGIAGVATYESIKPRYKMATQEDVLVFSCYFVGAVVCLSVSATYHTISNHSEVVAEIGNKLDYIGIVALMWGSFVPSIYYGFSTDPGLVLTYWTMITSIGLGTAIVCISPKFRSPNWRPFRASMFVAMGLSAVVPIFHGIKLYGIAQLEKQIGLSWLVIQGFLDILGAALYAVSLPGALAKDLITDGKEARIPERLRPGAFDIWGSSHQIFHVLVVIAAALHLIGLLKAFDNEHSSRLTLMAAYDSARKILPLP